MCQTVSVVLAIGSFPVEPFVLTLVQPPQTAHQEHAVSVLFNQQVFFSCLSVVLNKENPRCSGRRLSSRLVISGLLFSNMSVLPIYPTLVSYYGNLSLWCSHPWL